MSITAVASVAGAAAGAPVNSPKAPPASSAVHRNRPKDSVTISQAATAALAALKEATESAAQTASEAGAGDHQAQQLMAKEASARASGE